MALSQAELEQCKFWLGYGNLTALARPYFDIAVVFEDVVQKTLDVTWAEGYVRNTILVNLTALDVQLQAQIVLQAQATELVGDVKIDAMNAFRSLTTLSEYWKDQLSAVLKVPRVNAPGGTSIELM
jgi:hypothetical protein